MPTDRGGRGRRGGSDGLTGGAGIGILLGHSLLTQLVTFVLRPASTYRALELDVPVAWLGALSACFAVAPLLLAIPCGSVADRVGERRMAVAGGILVTASAVLLATTATSVAMLAVGTVVLGVGHLCCIVAQQTLVANGSQAAGMDTAFGHYTFAVSLGQALGPGVILVFGRGRSIPDTAAIFVAACVLAGLLFVLSLWFAVSGTHLTLKAVDAPGLASVVRLPGLGRALMTSSTILAAIDISLVYLPALGAERGISAGAIGALLSIRGLASMGSRLFLGRLSAWLGRRRLLVGSTLMAAAALAATALPAPVPVLAVLMVLVGVGLGVGQPLTMSWLASSVPAGLRGRAMSLRLVGNRAGQVAIPSLAGALAAGAGAAGVLAATAVGLVAIGVAARHLPVDTDGQPG